MMWVQPAEEVSIGRYDEDMMTAKEVVKENDVQGSSDR